MTRDRATCDTSVAVPAFLSWHEQHEVCRRALTEQVQAVPAHVVAEVFSVLTRLPAPHRISAASALVFVESLPGPFLDLSGARVLDVVSRLARQGVVGGAVYEGLVAAAAVDAGLELLTLDRRAQPTYALLGASVRVP